MSESNKSSSRSIFLTMLDTLETFRSRAANMGPLSSEWCTPAGVLFEFSLGCFTGVNGPREARILFFPGVPYLGVLLLKIIFTGVHFHFLCILFMMYEFPLKMAPQAKKNFGSFSKVDFLRKF